MRTIEFYYPHLAKLIRIGKTHEGRPIEGLKLGYHVSNSTKRVFWIDGNVCLRVILIHILEYLLFRFMLGNGLQVTVYVKSIFFI